jgi:hypothetical protein
MHSGLFRKQVGRRPNGQFGLTVALFMNPELGIHPSGCLVHGNTLKRGHPAALPWFRDSMRETSFGRSSPCRFPRGEEDRKTKDDRRNVKDPGRPGGQIEPANVRTTGVLRLPCPFPLPKRFSTFRCEDQGCAAAHPYLIGRAELPLRQRRFIFQTSQVAHE